MSVVRIEVDAELEALVAIVAAAASRAGELYREHLVEALEVDEKAPGDPVTRADRELDEQLTRALRSRFPEAGIVGEESAPTGEALAAELAKDEVFFVDPIDGTREFVERTGEFAVMVGLARGGRAAAGVIALPSEGLLLAGRVGQRAFSQTKGGARSLVAVSSTDRFEQARLLVSRSHRPAIVEPLRRRLGVGAVVPCGSVGVKAARIALGEAEVYVHGGHGLSCWDTCAAEAILAASGGRLSDLDGRAVDYRGPTALSRGLVATNGILHPGVMSAVSWAEREAERVSLARR